MFQLLTTFIEMAIRWKDENLISSNSRWSSIKRAQYIKAIHVPKFTSQVSRLLTCLSLSRVRMFSTARTLRRYFSMATSLSADWLLSVLAASRANISLSSGPWMSYSKQGDTVWLDASSWFHLAGFYMFRLLLYLADFYYGLPLLTWDGCRYNLLDVPHRKCNYS